MLVIVLLVSQSRSMVSHLASVPHLIFYGGPVPQTYEGYLAYLLVVIVERNLLGMSSVMLLVFYFSLV